MWSVSWRFLIYRKRHETLDSLLYGHLTALLQFLYLVFHAVLLSLKCQNSTCFPSCLLQSSAGRSLVLMIIALSDDHVFLIPSKRSQLLLYPLPPDIDAYFPHWYGSRSPLTYLIRSTPLFQNFNFSAANWVGWYLDMQWTYCRS